MEVILHIHHPSSKDQPPDTNSQASLLGPAGYWSSAKPWGATVHKVTGMCHFKLLKVWISAVWSLHLGNPCQSSFSTQPSPRIKHILFLNVRAIENNKCMHAKLHTYCIYANSLAVHVLWKKKTIQTPVQRPTVATAPPVVGSPSKLVPSGCWKLSNGQNTSKWWNHGCSGIGKKKSKAMPWRFEKTLRPSTVLFYILF